MVRANVPHRSRALHLRLAPSEAPRGVTRNTEPDFVCDRVTRRQHGLPNMSIYIRRTCRHFLFFLQDLNLWVSPGFPLWSLVCFALSLIVGKPASLFSLRCNKVTTAPNPNLLTPKRKQSRVQTKSRFVEEGDQGLDATLQNSAGEAQTPSWRTGAMPLLQIPAARHP